jgi:hypothetical protein
MCKPLLGVTSNLLSSLDEPCRVEWLGYFW